MKKRINKAPLYVVGFATSAMLVLVVWTAIHRQEAAPMSKIDPFSGPLVIDAPGCEINGPDGSSIKDVIRGSEQVIIPKGTSFNGDCFPAAKAAREADS